MNKIQISKNVLVELYNQGMSVNEIVTYLKENYNAKITRKNVLDLYNSMGMNMRNKPKKGLKFEIVDEEVEQEEVDELAIEYRDELNYIN